MTPIGSILFGMTVVCVVVAVNLVLEADDNDAQIRPGIFGVLGVGIVCAAVAGVVIP